MKILNKKALLVLTCICALQLPLMVHGAEKPAPTKKPKSSLLSKLKNTTADVKKSMTSSGIKNGIKVKLIKVNEAERKNPWSFQVVDPSNAVIGKPLTFSKDKIVTFDPSKNKQTLQVFTGPNVSGTPAASKEIEIDSGKIKGQDIKTKVLIVSNTDLIFEGFTIPKGIYWLPKTEVENIRWWPVILQNLDTLDKNLQKEAVKAFSKAAQNTSEGLCDFIGDSKTLTLIQVLLYTLKSSTNLLNTIKSGLKSTKSDPKKLDSVSESYSNLNDIHKTVEMVKEFYKKGDFGWAQDRFKLSWACSFLKNFPEFYKKLSELLQALKQESLSRKQKLEQALQNQIWK